MGIAKYITTAVVLSSICKKALKTEQNTNKNRKNPG